MSTLTATAYLQIKRDWGSRAKVTRVTQNMPSIIDPDAFVVRLQISVPSEAFVPPLAVVGIPPEAIQHPPVEIKAVPS